MTNCDFVAGDAYAPATLAPEPADLVFLANAFHGVPDRPRLARAVRAALKQDGRFAIVNWHRRPREQTVILGEPRGPKTELRLSPQQTIAAVEAGGLKLARLIEVPPYHYGAIFERPPAWRAMMPSILDNEYIGAVGLPAGGIAARGAAAEGSCDRRCAAGLPPGPGRRYRSAAAQTGEARPFEGRPLPCHRSIRLRSGAELSGSSAARSARRSPC